MNYLKAIMISIFLLSYSANAANEISGEALLGQIDGLENSLRKEIGAIRAKAEEIDANVSKFSKANNGGQVQIKLQSLF